MLSFLPKTKTKGTFATTELLPTHEPFYKKYALVLIVFVLVFLVAIVAFGGILFRTTSQFAENIVTKKSVPIDTTVEMPKKTNFSDLKLETGYTLKKNNEWEVVFIVNEPNQVELIASSEFNATRVEITSYTKDFPDWEDNIGLVYFDLDDKDEKTINGNSVKILKGKDGSLYAKTGTWEDNDKVLEVRVFSANKKSTDQIFDQLAKSVNTNESTLTDDMQTDESSQSTNSSDAN